MHDMVTRTEKHITHWRVPKEVLLHKLPIPGNDIQPHAYSEVVQPKRQFVDGLNIN